ncbi:hypothetical protein PC116_g3613 [Phytophthora cactorum]|uniref:Uncharacterized protein n=2 Tax=Phytophthora cactorum TaxID=29920 RepID=A0A8T1EPF3_9STRA|nr:hypothetical protein Pcac1_g13634 [Phytophthora cactorum]KAG2931930.1 hypothetical protein PC114_g1982 [Phytophthora cactorum]KAG2953762.1 hypothetical protein PC117_g1741 [Phytophthora cactorum]KAG3038623.1 hypothetical protein PC119_g2730 [Phytophthora cactorum]KAG4248609.1 hypothetical protein PC116_g3613 [Phytophthora cactorum]
MGSKSCDRSHSAAASRCPLSRRYRRFRLMQCSKATDEWTVALVQASAGEIFNGNDGKGHNDSHEAGCDGTSCDGSSSDDPSSRR